MKFSINGVLLVSFTDSIKQGNVHRVYGVHLSVYNNNKLALYKQKSLSLNKRLEPRKKAQVL
jgi:hypothetical protein